MPGDSGNYEWSGYIPFDEMPQALDPPGGIIATANSRVVGPAYPHFLTATWMSPWRTDRIYQLLGRQKDFQPRDFANIQADIVDELDWIVAMALVKATESSKARDDRTARLIQMLAKWDGRMTADSIEATFVEQTRRALERNLFYPYLGETPPTYPRIDVFDEHVLRERPAFWLPPEFQNYDQLLIASADLAVAELTTSTGSQDISNWRWGKRNALFMPHALGQSGILAKLFSIGPVDQSGAPGCIRAMGTNHGPSMRLVADLSDWDHSYMEITTGESGQVGSPHYRDQFTDWFADRCFTQCKKSAGAATISVSTVRRSAPSLRNNPPKT
jgi:penicillin amidase